MMIVREGHTRRYTGMGGLDNRYPESAGNCSDLEHISAEAPRIVGEDRPASDTGDRAKVLLSDLD